MSDSPESNPSWPGQGASFPSWSVLSGQPVSVPPLPSYLTMLDPMEDQPSLALQVALLTAELAGQRQMLQALNLAVQELLTWAERQASHER